MLLKKCIYLFLFLFSYALLSGQQPYHRIPAQTKSIKKIKGFGDDQGNSCLVYERNATLYFSFLNDATGELVQQQINTAAEGQIKLIGMQYDQEFFYLYYLEQYSENSLIVYSVPKSTDQEVQMQVIDLPVDKKDKLVDTYYHFNQVYLIYTNKKSYEVSVIQLANPNDIVEHNIPSNKLFYSFLKRKKFKNVYPDIEPVVTASTARKKLFMLSPDQMIFLSDKPVITELEVGPTEIVFLNLREKKLTKKRLKLNQEVITSKSINSFIHEEQIYRLMITNDFLQLSVYQMSDLSLVKNFFYPKGEPIEMIALQKVYQGAVDFPPVVPFEKPKALHRNLKRGTPTLSVATVDSNLVKVRVGSYLNNKDRGNVPAMNPDGSFSQGLSNLGPDQTITYFDVFLDKSSWEFTQPLDYTDPLRKEAEFLEDLFPSNELRISLTGNAKSGKPVSFSFPHKTNQRIHGYFDKKSAELILHKF